METLAEHTAHQLLRWPETWDGHSLHPVRSAVSALEAYLSEARQQPTPDVDALATLLNASVASFLALIDFAPPSIERRGLLEKLSLQAAEICSYIAKAGRR